MRARLFSELACRIGMFERFLEFPKHNKGGSVRILS